MGQMLDITPAEETIHCWSYPSWTLEQGNPGVASMATEKHVALCLGSVQRVGLNGTARTQGRAEGHLRQS